MPTGTELRARREALALSADRLARYAGVSRRSVNYAEAGRGGRQVISKIDQTLARLEAGEELAEQEHIVRLEARPGVWITVDAENEARLGDVRSIEDAIRDLIKKYGGQA